MLGCFLSVILYNKKCGKGGSRLGKSFSEMSLEELWRLFPIFLMEHQPEWKKWYMEEERRLQDILPRNQKRRISHIGSTSVRNIWAKPIIDILMEVSKECNLEGIRDLLLDNGYLCMSESKDRISFNKGYTENGFAKKVYHLHLRYAGDNDELYFRDYLMEYPEIAKKYEELKLDLWEKFEYNRDEYTNNKTEFIRGYTNKAKKEYGQRY